MSEGVGVSGDGVEAGRPRGRLVGTLGEEPRHGEMKVTGHGLPGR